jgi:multiple sugar transport system ATP-binding protein
MASVSLTDVGKVYPDGTRALTQCNLEIADGEFMVLIGPSGCGKTTLLRMIAGLEDISEGELCIGGDVVNTLEPRKRDIAMVFQNYALYPHLNVFENIAFPLRSQHVPRVEIQAKVEETAAKLGLTSELRRKPRNLSGGQRQRVAMGRAIVRQPHVFLMDEPLSNLDSKLRAQMRTEVVKLQRDLGVTTIYVTHDQTEAMTMGDRIAVMRKGELQQYGAPEELYDHPINLFVATFLGSPPMNLFHSRLETGDHGMPTFAVGGHRVDLTSGFMADHPDLKAHVGGAIAVGIRPEHLVRAEPEARADFQLNGSTAMVEALGHERLVHVDVQAEPVVTQDVLDVVQDIDVTVLQSLQQDNASQTMLITARFDTSGATPSIGQPLRLGTTLDHLHFFDPKTGSAIC